MTKVMFAHDLCLRRAEKEAGKMVYYSIQRPPEGRGVRGGGGCFRERERGVFTLEGAEDVYVRGIIS